MQRSLFLPATMLACALCAQTALASPLATASSSVSGLSYRLVDLDPNDGVTPSITFNQNYLILGADENGSPQVQIAAGDPFGAVANTVTGNGLLSSNDGGIRTSAQLSSGSVQNLPVDPSSDITGVYYNGAVVFSAYGSGVPEGIPFPPDGGFSWTLSANTALIIEGTAQASAQADLSQLAQGSLLQGAQDNAYGLQMDSYGSFTVQLLANAGVSAVTGNELPELRDGVDVLAEAHQGLNRDGIFTAEGESSSQNAQQSFSIQIANLSTESRGGVLSLYAGSQNSLGFTGSLPVPEPGTFAFMGLGLGLIAWRTRARRG